MPDDTGGYGGDGGVEEKNNSKKSGLATATVVVPPDGGWGWVVMCASFFCNLLVDGIVMNAGSFAEPIEKEFNASKSQVSQLYLFYLNVHSYIFIHYNIIHLLLTKYIGSFS